MTLFLSATALQTDERGQDVIDAVFTVLGGRGHRRLPKSMAARTTGDYQVMLSTESPEWLFIVYPQGFLDGYGCTQELSKKFECRAFNFEVYNNETWWYNFFREGELLDVYWQQPRYFEGRHPDEVIDDEVLKLRAGNPDLIADQFFGLPLEVIKPYYQQVDDSPFRNLREQDPDGYMAKFREAMAALDHKAHPEDLYPLSSVWVFTDFGAKFGIIYPVDIQTHTDLAFFALRPKE